MSANSKIVLIQTNEEDQLINDKLEMMLSKLTLKESNLIYNSTGKFFEVDNKYFNCKLELKIVKQNLLEDFLSNNKNVEGVFVICDLLDANNIDKLEDIFSLFKNKGFNSDNFLSLLLFKECLDDAESIVDMEKLRNLAFDYSIEIITSILQYQRNEDEGLFRLCEAVNSNFWSNVTMKNKKLKEKIDDAHIINNTNTGNNSAVLVKDKDEINKIDVEDVKETNKSGNSVDDKEVTNTYNDHINNKDIKVTEIQEPFSINNMSNIPYTKFVDNDDDLIRKLIEIKNMNKQPNISDEERRVNAEKAMYSLFMMGGLEEGEEANDSSEENN